MIPPRVVVSRPVRPEERESSERMEKVKSGGKLTVRTYTRLFAFFSGLERCDAVTAAPVEEFTISRTFIKVVTDNNGFTGPYIRFQFAGRIFLPARVTAD